MVKITISAAKPNPSGKDLIGALAPISQLHGEWVDIRNDAYQAVNLEQLSVYDKTFDNNCVVQGNREIYRFPNRFVLQPNEIVRIHSGRTVPISQLKQQDYEGANYHVFTESSYYVLNNKCGDTLALYADNGRTCWDKTSYRPCPIEGKILKRVADYLI